MQALWGWLRSRKAIATTLAMTLIVGVPLTFAVLHPGFPVSDVHLTSRDVWVTNSDQVLAGRLNRQIDELNGGLRPASASFDVFQDGDDVFLYDQTASTLERIDPSLTNAVQTTAVPNGAQVSYGGRKLAILSPDDGSLWIVDAAGELLFDYKTVPPVATLGAGSQAVVTVEGDVLAVSPDESSLYRFPASAGLPEQRTIEVPAEYMLTAVGSRAVLLDPAKSRLITADGTIGLDTPALRVQQVGPAADYVLVADGEGLLRVRFDGQVERLSAGIPVAVTSGAAVSAPVNLDGCSYGAWAGAQRGLVACEGSEPVSTEIPRETSGDKLEFRTNRHVIVLNNFRNGDTFLVDDNMRIVDNWEQVIPPDEAEEEASDEKSAEQTFEDAILERTEQNTAPTATDDTFGVRPGKTTIMAVLANDSDPDGDVLTITSVSDGYQSAGHVDLIDGGRALQFTPLPTATGTVSFRYTIDDGRPGGVAEATVSVTIRTAADNAAPRSFRAAAVTVEIGQSVSYNVLADWIDPDGDDLVLDSAESTTGDQVRFSADGFVTFLSTNGELGPREVNFVVSDGTELSTPGVLVVDVKETGTLGPIGTPDFATTFIGEEVSIRPLTNDVSRSGGRLALQGVESQTDGGTAEADLDQGIVTFTAPQAGAYYVRYALGAGAISSYGMIRIDVAENPAEPLPPIAVKDTGYLRGSETTTVNVLANDVSPSGRVLGIQTITIPPEAASLKVETLSNTLLRISANPPITTQLQFTYTISDGYESSSATVTVVPVDPLVKTQAPIAVDDTIKVRAGDVASIAVLDNDYSPDKTPFSLDPELLDAGSGGLAFITGDRVRFQAPSEPGSYSVVYGITDTYEQQATARVTFAVLPDDEQGNQAPNPQPLTARVYAGSYVTVEVPLDGIDPDGDSVVLLPFTSSLALGEITGKSSVSFTYLAYPDKVGTDTFTYEVIDALGDSAVGQVKIGVIPRTGEDMQPIAVNDSAAIRPGRTTTINVLSNDSDPNGYLISIADDSLEVPDGISAELVENAVVVTAGDEEGVYNLAYTLSNGKGGSANAIVTVEVSATAPPQYPVAQDHVIEKDDLVGLTSYDVDVFEGAQNPGGRVKDLVVALEGPNADAAEVLQDGSVRVTPGPKRQAIAYSLTNEEDDLAATAFIIVPAAPGDGYDSPPIIDPELEPQVIGAGERKTWRLDDILLVPSGRPAILMGEDTTIANRGNGDSAYLDERTLVFTPETGFRGETSITFDVTDGSSPNDPKGNTNTLQLKFTVGDPNFEDQAPTFTTPSLVVAADDTTTFDLRTATAHPNPAVLAAISYSGLENPSGEFSTSLSGSVVTLTAPRSAAVGTTAVVPVTLTYKQFTVEGTIKVSVVSSLEPLAQTVDDHEFAKRGSTSVVSVLANDVNPFPDESLRIVTRSLENSASGASVSGSDTAVAVGTNPTFVGDVAVIYRVQDATADPTREVNGRLVVTVWDAPDAVSQPTFVSNEDHQVTIRFSPPVNNNGSTITGYTVGNGAGAEIACTAGVDCVFGGLDNGTPYSFTVVVHGSVDGSAIINQSQASAALIATAYATPAQLAPPAASNGPAGAGTVNITWSATSYLGGGGADYQWSQVGSGSWHGVGDNYSASPNIGIGNSAQFIVRVCNSGGKCSADSGASNVATAPNPPPVITGIGKSGTTTPCTLSGVLSTCAFIRLYSSTVTGQVSVCMYGRQHNSGAAYGQWDNQECYNATFSGGSAVTAFYLNNAGNVGAFDVLVKISGVSDYYATIW